MLVPKLRFKEFKNEWETINLKQILSFKNGINANKDSYGRGIKYISVGDILNNTFITYDKIKGLVDINEKMLNENSVEYGDIVFQRSSETFNDIGQSNVYLDKEKVATFGGFVIRGKKVGNYNPLFLNYLLKSPYNRRKIIIKGAGAQHYNISQEELEKININFTNETEQEKIGNFLSLLDKKIELQQKKIEALKIYKIGLIQELFSFNTFYEKKLEDICNITTGKLDANAMTPNGKYRFYTCAKEYYYINTYAFDTEALLISGNGAYVGYIHYYKGKFNAYQRTYVLDNFSENILYIKYYMDTFLAKRILAERKEGNTPYIVLNTLAKMPIIFPSSKVQNQIVTTLIKFDTKLDLENKKLYRLNIMKKSLLQQMFI